MKKYNFIACIFFIALNIGFLFIPFWYYNKYSNDNFFYFTSFEYLQYWGNENLGLVHLFPFFAFIVIILLITTTTLLFFKQKKEFWVVIPIFAHFIANFIENIAYKIFIENLNPIYQYEDYSFPLISSNRYGFFFSLAFSILGLLFLLNSKFHFVEKLIVKCKTYLETHKKPTKAERIAELEKQVAELKAKDSQNSNS